MLTKYNHYYFTLISNVVIVGSTLYIGINTELKIFFIIYLMLDMICFLSFMDSSMIVHHIISISLTFLSWGHPCTKQVVLMEISTPFLICYRIGFYKYISMIIFILSFFYFRIIQIGLLLYNYRYCIYSVDTWLMFVLYLQNCSWFEKIIRKYLVNDNIKLFLESISPYTHFCSLLALYRVPYISVFVTLSSIASWFWHTYRLLCFYIIDLVCFHLLSFSISIAYVLPKNSLVFLSLPFHIIDVLFYYKCHRLWLLMSLGWDVLMVFIYYKRDVFWLFGWVIIAMINSRQTFGYGSTQSIVHVLIAFLLSVF